MSAHFSVNLAVHSTNCIKLPQRRPFVHICVLDHPPDMPTLLFKHNFPLQLRSVSFLRLCLERSGKPVLASGDALTKLPDSQGHNVSAPNNSQGAEAMYKVGNEKARVGEGRQARFDVDNTISSSENAKDLAHRTLKTTGNLHSWLEVVTSETLSKQVTPAAQGRAGALRSEASSKSPDAFSMGKSLANASRRSEKPVTLLEEMVLSSSPRRRSLSPRLETRPMPLSPAATRLMDSIRTSSQKVKLESLIHALDPAPGSNEAMMTGAHWMRGTAKVWGGNWGLRDANLSMQHEAYRALSSPTGGTGAGIPSMREQKLLCPLPEFQQRGEHAIEEELQKVFRAYARPTNLFPSSSANTVDGSGKHDWYSDKKIGELVLGTNLAQKESFEALDDNGNGKLSSGELKMGMRNMGNVWLGLARVKSFLGARADEDLSYEEFISIVKNRIAQRHMDSYDKQEDVQENFDVGIGHLGFRRFVADLLRFQREDVPIPSLDRAFLMGAGYGVALPHVLEFVRDDNPVDSGLPIYLTFPGFRNALMKQLSA